MKQINTDNTTRVEIIDETWRVYTNYNCKNVEVVMQDNDKTLKIFLTPN